MSAAAEQVKVGDTTPAGVKRKEEYPMKKMKPSIMTDILGEDNVFHAEPGDLDGDAKDLILTRLPSTNVSCDLWIRKNLIGKYTDLVNKMLGIKTETPFHDAVESIKAASSWTYVEGVYVNFDGTFKPRMIPVKAECLPEIILQGDTYRLEGDQYVHKFSVGDIDYADVLSVVYDDDEEEEVIDITHLMGDLTEIPF